MTLKNFLEGIKFKFLHPNDPAFPPGAHPLSGFRDKKGNLIEFTNTIFPCLDPVLKSRLFSLTQVPRMSTLAIGGLINYAVSLLAEDEAYVNVGVWNGFSLLCGLVGNYDKLCIGIDNFSEFGGPKEEFMQRFERLHSPRHKFFECDYREYFSKIHQGKIGLYFYDGEHSYQNQLEGLLVAEPFFSQNCTILVDDTNWEEPRKATYDFLDRSQNNYEILLDVKTCTTPHPTWWNGLIVLQRCPADNLPQEG